MRKPKKRSPSAPGDRRERLLAAARELFFTRGYEATRMEDIASAAGFSKRTVYLEFPSKGALFAVLCEEGIEMLRDALVPILGQRLPVAEELNEIARRYLKFSQQHRGHYRLLFLWATDEVLADAAPAQRKRLKEVETTCVDVLARAIDRARADGVLKKDLDAWKTAMLVWASLNGVLLVREHSLRTDMAGTPIDDLYWRTVELFLAGAASA